MEKKMKERGSIEAKVFWMLKALLCSYAVTGILLILLTVLLYKLNLDEQKIMAGISAIYIISAFAGGFAAGKMAKVKKFAWGMITGILYFVLLLLISFGIYHTVQESGGNLLVTFLLCAGGGMLGGMVS